MIKKGEIITILTVLLFVYITDSAKAEITDVEITPDEPTMEDIITIDTSGTEGSGPVAVIDSVVNITDTEIGLDLILEVGPYAVITPGSYSEDIGILPAGMYDLTVRTIVNSVLTDTYFKTFQVVPAPPMTLDGSGTEQDPWLIKSLEDFNDFAADANYWDDYTRLETDVNLAGRIYATAVIAPAPSTAFTGIFDGNDHKITNLTIDDGGAGNEYLGLFGYLDDPNTEIKDLTLVAPDVNAIGDSDYVGCLVGYLRGGTISGCGVEVGSISGDEFIGGLVGYSVEGTITNCYAKGSISGDHMTGGLVGRTYLGTISNCHVTANVSGDYRTGGLVGLNAVCPISYCHVKGEFLGNYPIGGLVGENLSSTISNCHAAGRVTGGGDTGGLVGEHSGGTIWNCFAMGQVSGGWSSGGLVGDNDDGTISHCYATTVVSGYRETGGLVGYNIADINDCYAKGSVSGAFKIGGLVGDNRRPILNCYSTGNVSGDCYIGGLVGYNDCSFSNCYSIGAVDGNDFTGGLIGINFGPFIVIEYCFWDVNTSGMNTSYGGTGKTTAEMQTKSTFTDADWDFSTPIWKMNCEGMSYPKLSWWQPVPGDFLCPDGVDFFDFSFFAGHWAEDNCGASNDCDGTDLNLLGTVENNDLRIFVDNWLR